MATISLREGEKTLLWVRRHPVVVTVPMIIAVLILALAFFLMIPLFKTGWFGIVIFVLLVIFSLCVALRSWLLWRGTRLIVTNQRVIDVDRVSLFGWAVSDLRYENMADISYETHGPLQALFGSGDVILTTTSGSHALKGDFIPDPAGVREVIVKTLKVAEAKRGATGFMSAEKTADDEGLAPDAERAVRRYAEHLKKRKEMLDFFKTGGTPDKD